MEPESSLLCSPKLTIRHYSQPQYSSSQLHGWLLCYSFLIIFSSKLSSCKWSLSSDILPKIVYAFFTSLMHAIYPAYLIVQNSITLIIFHEEHKLWNTPLCNILHSQFNSPRVGTGIFNSTCSQITSIYVGREVLTSVAIKNSIFWNIAPCTTLSSGT
jgi:hypothetical protein